MQFMHLDALMWMWIAVAAGVLVATSMGARRRMWLKLATAKMRTNLQATAGRTRHGLRGVLLVAALVLLVIGLMDPRWGVRFEPVSQRNIDVMFVLDTSRSMKAGDLAPSRLQRAREYIDDVIDVAAGDRIGLVSFAGHSHLEVPLTRDTMALTLALDAIDVRGGRAGGSMLGDAIRLATESFTGEGDGERAIILLSDGEDMGSWPAEAAAAAREAGIRIWTVGLGDADTGARIPLDIDGERVFLTHDGAEVWTKMDPTVLEAVALAGEGAFIPAGTSNLDLADVYESAIAPAAGRRTAAAMVERPIPRYNWFVIPALSLILLEWVLGRCWTRPHAKVVTA